MAVVSLCGRPSMNKHGPVGSGELPAHNTVCVCALSQLIAGGGGRTEYTLFDSMERRLQSWSFASLRYVPFPSMILYCPEHGFCILLLAS